MNTKTFSKKLQKAARVLGELAAELGDDDAGRDGDDDAGDSGSHRRAARAAAQTEIDEPEIGWRMGFIRLCDGRCPWCGERIELVTCDSHGAGLTWKCPEACNP